MITEAHFEDIDHYLIRELRSARESIKICVAWINGNLYSQIFNEIASRGVIIEIIYNNDHINLKTPINSIPGINLYPIDTRIKSALMHNKFCIIDNETLITGSFNWSIKAKNSFENVIIVKHDFRLIKKFLHEFNDLINYYNYFGINSIQQCNRCRSHAYNFGIFREESGKYYESEVQVYKVCAANFHVELLSERYEQFIQSWLWDEHDDQDYWEEEYSKERMLHKFTNERAESERIQNYFSSGHSIPVHAVCFKHLANQAQHLKWGYPPDWEVKMLWRDMYYRKIIPSVLYDGQGDIENIIHNSVY